jgi:hypothetical protein
MMIRTDKIQRSDLFRALEEVSPLLDLEVTQHRSRTHARGFRVTLTWTGEKVKGDGRYRRNYGTGQWNAPLAATWDEWGEWMDKLFTIDPGAVIGQYKGRDDFMRQTADVLPWASTSKGAKAPWLED